LKPLLKPGTGVLSLPERRDQGRHPARELGEASVMGGVCYVATTIAAPA